VKGVRELHDMGYHFICISSCITKSNKENIERWRYQNLFRVFGESAIRAVICDDIGSDKSGILENFAGTGCIWIDDRPKNVDNGLKHGLDAFVYRTDMNADKISQYHLSCRSVSNWDEIVTQVQNSRIRNLP
jgi:hypothetical protein